MSDGTEGLIDVAIELEPIHEDLDDHAAALVVTFQEGSRRRQPQVGRSGHLTANAESGVAGDVASELGLGARMRRSASLAISSARRRARSERPPSASAWIRQAILRNRNCRWFDRDSSPKNSLYFWRSCPDVIVLRSLISFRIAACLSSGILMAVNLMSMRARSRGTVKWISVP